MCAEICRRNYDLGRSSKRLTNFKKEIVTVNSTDRWPWAVLVAYAT